MRLEYRTWGWQSSCCGSPQYLDCCTWILHSYKLCSGQIKQKKEENTFKDKDAEVNFISKDESQDVSSNKDDQTFLDKSEVDKIREGETYFGSNSSQRILEIGCGTGSTVFPILEMINSPSLVVYCCDLFLTAV